MIPIITQSGENWLAVSHSRTRVSSVNTLCIFSTLFTFFIVSIILLFLSIICICWKFVKFFVGLMLTIPILYIYQLLAMEKKKRNHFSMIAFKLLWAKLCFGFYYGFPEQHNQSYVSPMRFGVYETTHQRSY